MHRRDGDGEVELEHLQGLRVADFDTGVEPEAEGAEESFVAEEEKCFDGLSGDSPGAGGDIGGAGLEEAVFEDIVHGIAAKRPEVDD